MNVSNSDLRKDAELKAAVEAPKRIRADNQKRIDELDGIMFRTFEEARKWSIIGEDALSFALKTQYEQFKSERVHLKTDPLRMEEQARDARTKFIRPFKEQAIKDCGRLYARTERLKVFRETSRGYDETFALPVHKIESNFRPIIESLKKISETIQWIRDTDAPLSELVKRVEELEKELPTDFEFENLKIFGDSEFLSFSNFFGTRRETEDPTYMPTVHSKEILESQLAGIEAFKKPKSFTIA
jgi:hypothetical protein